MALKLYIFGLPGSGKSTIAHCVVAYLKDKNCSNFHFSDHVILEEMFLADTEHKKFKPAEHGGFNVIDFVVCDKALRELERIINNHILCAQQEGIVLIEFARNDYRRAFQQFSDKFLLDAYFLYLDVDLEICKNRVRERIAHPSSEDDFYVSEAIFNSYYNKDDGRSIPKILASDYDVGKERVKVVDNNGSLLDSIAQVYQFVDMMCGIKPL